MAYTNTWTVAAPLDTQAANQGAVDFRATKLDIMQRVASFGAGLLANRPTPEVTSGTADWTGVTYLATDTNQLFRWNGSSWDDISPDTPGGTAIALATTGTAVNVSSAAPPSAGQVLTATDATDATWQDNDAIGLKTTGSPVIVNGAAPPSAGQVLTALTATTADWETITDSGTPGVITLPGGIIIMYGTFNATIGVPSSGSEDTIAFPQSFPTNVLSFTFNFTNYIWPIGAILRVDAVSASGFNYFWDAFNADGNGNPCIVSWIAIGN